MKKHFVKNWDHLGSKVLQKTRVFDLLAKRMRSPDGSIEDDFYFIRANSWVNVIAITQTDQVVMVEQFRHGVQHPTLELPGGIIDEEVGETPEKSARRELLEETGYSGEQLIDLGYSHPNPAIQANLCHHYLMPCVKLEALQNLDRLEDIHVHLVPQDSIPQLLKEQEITHSLVLSAFMRYELYLRNSNHHI